MHAAFVVASAPFNRPDFLLREALVPWSDRAFSAMKPADEMGRDAAQIAVATKRPSAIEKTTVLMDDILRKN